MYMYGDYERNKMNNLSLSPLTHMLLISYFRLAEYDKGAAHFSLRLSVGFSYLF